MRKTLLAVLILVFLPIGLSAQPLGGEAGFIIQKGVEPVFAYATVTTIDFGEWAGQLLSGMTIAGVKSNAHWQGTNETYAIRTILERRIKFGYFVGSIGSGVWVFMSTEKSDPAVSSFRASAGFETGPVYAYISGDVIGWEGQDSYFVGLGVQISLK